MVINTRSFGRFWPVSWNITHCFGVPKRFPSLTIPNVRLLVRSQQSQFWPSVCPFLGLLLTVLGSQSDFHSWLTPRCAYVSVINTYSFGRFWPVSWTITLFWGLGVISTIDEPRGAFTCRSSTLTYLADSSPFCALLLSILGIQGDFDD